MHDAKTPLSDLIARAEAGEEIVIARRHKPAVRLVAKVVPVEKKQRVPGRFAHLRGNLPPDLFDQPLEQDELDAWDGKYSGGDGEQ